MSNRSTAHLLFGFQLEDWFDLPRELGCELVSIGSDVDDQSIFLVAVELNVEIAYPLQLDLADLLSKEADARERMTDYCAMHGVVLKELAWHLAAAYN